MREQKLTRLLQVIGTLALRRGLLRELLTYLEHYIQVLGLPYVLRLRDSLLYFCERDQERCIVSKIDKDKLHPVVLSNVELCRTLLQLSLRFLGTRGRKRIVSLYTRTGDLLVKLAPGGMNKLVIAISRASQLLIILIIALIFTSLVALGLPMLLSVVLTLSLLNLLMVVFPEVAVRFSRLPEFSQGEIYKLEVVLPEDVEDHVLKTVLRVLRSSSKIELKALDSFLTLLRELSGGEVNVRKVMLGENVVDEMRRNRVRILILSSERPDAFSVHGIRKYVVITTKLLAMLDDAELDAVVAHEVGHLARSHIPITLFFSSVIYALVPLLTKFMLSLRVDITSLIVTFLFFVTGSILLSWMFLRRLEMDADTYAIRTVGPQALAEALISVAWRQLILELERPRLAFLTELFSTHPLVSRRICRIFSDVS